MMTPLHLRLVAGLAAATCMIVPACSSSDETSATTASSSSDSASASTIGQVATTEALPDTTEAATSTDVTTAVTEPPTATTPDLLGSYTLADDEFGTMVTVTVADGTRTIVTNALPDHETGEFPNQGNPNTITAQDLTWSFPTEPVFTGSATIPRIPGVAVNGVKFEPATAESVTCASGETYPVEAMQDTYDLGLDFNNAHVQPTGEYHYHGISQLLTAAYESDDDLVLVGFAADGYLMYYSKSGAYEPGYELSSTPRTGTGCVGTGRIGDVGVEGSMPDGTYTTDWVFTGSESDLDSCNGTTIDGEYAYIVTDTYPFVSRCLNGETPEAGNAPGAGTAGGGAAPAGGPPDLADAAAALGVTEDALRNALGAPPPDLEAAAEILGISVDELAAVLPARP